MTALSPLTSAAPWARDAQNLRRIMGTVLLALIPVFVMGCFNTGFQANLAIGVQGMAPTIGWREDLLGWLGIAHDHHSFMANLLRGAMWMIPPLIVSFVVGGFWEWLFCRVRGLAFNESFWVTAALYGLSLPVGLPMWKAALGISFGIIFAKQVFGGAGYNVFNTMLVSRGFLFFSFPHHFSGAQPYAAVDGYTTATPLTTLGEYGIETLRASYTWTEAFIGLTPGSLGETSAAACLIGAVILIATGVASWRIIGGIVVGVIIASLLFNALAPGSDNLTLATPFWWHLVIGSVAFGGVYMATDPVTAPSTPGGRLIYGLMIGLLLMSIRCLNPAYSEGTLLSILLMNTFAPLIDHCVITWRTRHRRRRVQAS